MSMTCITCAESINPDNRYSTLTRINTDSGERTETYQHERCVFEERRVSYEETGVIRSSLWLDATLIQIRRGGNKDVLDSRDGPWVDKLLGEMEPVTAAAREWELAVWFGGQEPWLDDEVTVPYKWDPRLRHYKEDNKGRRLEGVLPEGSLQAFVVPAKYKGYGATVEGISYLSYSMAGRSIFQIATEGRDNTFVSIILDETSATPRGGVRSIQATPSLALELIQTAIQHWKEGKIKLEHGENIGFLF